MQLSSLIQPGGIGGMCRERRRQNGVEVVEDLFLEYSAVSDFISADIRSLIQTLLHPLCTSLSRIQTGRLQQMLSDICIDCIFQFLWKQRCCSDVFGLIFSQGFMLNSLAPELHCFTEREVRFMQSVQSSCNVPSDLSFLQSVPAIWHY